MTNTERSAEREMAAATAACLADPPTESTREDWRTLLLRTNRGKCFSVVGNALIALREAPEWQGVLHFNESSLDTVVKARPPWEERRVLPFTWTAQDDIRFASWLQHQGINANSNIAGQAVETVAREHPFHPIRDYFNSLEWDGTKRIDDWLTLYLGAEPDSTGYLGAIGPKFLIGAVARTFRPGCKNDTCLILEGAQGTLKSTALRALADPWFTDDMPELGTKDAALQTRGVLLTELSELDAMNKSEIARVKAFVSRNVDRFRAPYDRRPSAVPRECVFAGTTNHSSYLKDETGGRRFWPVKCGAIKIEDLRRDRDQLWAEAVHRYRADEKWWLEDKALVDAASDEQKKRYEEDPWEEKITIWCEGRGGAGVTVADILEFALEIPKSQWTQAHNNRVARVLVSNGLKLIQRRRKDDWKKRERVYVTNVTTLETEL